MSAHDFQAKCASVMDSALQTAIAETTKLFEAVVDELKAEMSRIKKENDELRARCSGCERVHRAVQCGEWGQAMDEQVLKPHVTLGLLWMNQSRVH